MSSILIVEDHYFLAMDCVREVERRGLKALAAGKLKDAFGKRKSPIFAAQ
jgi:ActR/RegA family two-component response regulator